MVRFDTGGWHWPAFFLGPVWYLYKGMVTKGVWLLLLGIATIGLAIPFLAFYCGAKGKSDWYNYRLRIKSRIDINKI